MKHAEVLSGAYQGKTAIILGLDKDILGHSIIKENSEMGWDFMKRAAMEGNSMLDPVLICNIDGKEIALSKSNFKKGKNVKGTGTGNKGAKSGSKSND